MVRFQKLVNSLFLILHGHNIHCQQRKLSTILMHYSSLPFMLTAGSWDQFPRWLRCRRRLSEFSVLRCPDLWLQCSVTFVHGLKKDAPHKNNVLKVLHSTSKTSKMDKLNCYTFSKSCTEFCKKKNKQSVLHRLNFGRAASLANVRQTRPLKFWCPGMWHSVALQEDAHILEHIPGVTLGVWREYGWVTWFINDGTGRDWN
jgi:hypothetical protein